MSRNPRIHVTIGQLVLHGFPAEQRDALAASLQAALQREFADPALPREIGGSRHVAALRTQPMSLPPSPTSNQIGVAGARQLIRRLRA